MRYRTLTQDLLVRELADAIGRRTEPRPRIGFDGFEEIGATALADAVAQSPRELSRPVVRVATRWWWRAASLRLELGRTDVDVPLYGWVDTGTLRRELLDPVATGSCSTVTDAATPASPVAAGSPAGYLPRLRDPATDRPVRDSWRTVEPRTAPGITARGAVGRGR
ncbi:MAG TPA: hypothetical protein VIC62_01375 [Nakamurella sp.]